MSPHELLRGLKVLRKNTIPSQIIISTHLKSLQNNRVV